MPVSYFRNVLLIGFIGYTTWGALCGLLPDVVDSIFIRMPITLPALGFYFLSYRSKFISNNIEKLCYLLIFAAVTHFMILSYINNFVFIHGSGLYALTSTATFAIVSKRFLFSFAAYISLISIIMAFWNFDNYVMILFWLNLLTTITVSSFFSLGRIQNLEDLKRLHEENLVRTGQMQTLFNTARQVAHDIRSPLSALEMVSGSLSEKDSARKDIIQRVTQRINGIADDLLQKHRSMHDKPMATTEVSSLNEVIHGLVEEKRVANIRVKIMFDEHTHEADQPLPIKLSDISRVLSNLINNSVEALEDSDSGKIELATKSERNALSIVIKDNGKGIPKNVQSDLFKSGFSFGKSKGNGLGLAHAKETLNKYSGTIELNSEEGKGTVVTIRIPKNFSS